jgi:hypothetical protein
MNEEIMTLFGPQRHKKRDSETFTVKYWFAPAKGFVVFRWFLGKRKLPYTMGFKHLMAKGHISYCGLVRGTHVEK